jgi:hypothetical protein
MISFSSNLSILSEMHAAFMPQTGGSLALMMHRSWRLQVLNTRLHIQICPATQEYLEQWKWEAEYVPVVFSGLIGVWFARFGFVRNLNRLHGSNALFITYLVATTVLVAILSNTFHGMSPS